jgi:precorrin-2 dehydrogenase / sirohydrochlorin ferrochelatase
MSDYPIFLNLQGRLAVVVGGGTVGLRKVRGLLAAGAKVRLVEPRGCAMMAEGLEVLCRPYRDGDLAGALLAFAATDDRQVNAAVLREGKAEGILVNVADVPTQGDFSLPAVLRRGGLLVAIGSGGQSPALAGCLRDILAAQIGDEWGTVLEVVAALRQKHLTDEGKSEYNSRVLRQLLKAGLPALVAAGDEAGVDRLLSSLCGPEISLATLGIPLRKG